MNSPATATATAFKSPFSRSNLLQWRHLPNPPISCSSRRHQPQNRLFHANKKPKSKPRNSSDQGFHIVIDAESISHNVSSSFQNLLEASQSKLRGFVHSGQDAFEDLQTLVAVDHNRRIVISCRRSTLEFVGHLVLWSSVLVVAFRVLGDLELGFRGRFGFRFRWGGLIRRDRSLGGREVLVAKKKKGFRVSNNPLSLPHDVILKNVERVPKPPVREEEKLPSWWLDAIPQPAATMYKEEDQMEARRLIRAITESRMIGKDISRDDIIRLRRICRASGVRVSFDAVNTRKSIYRVAVELIIDICSSATVQSSSFQIDGEDAPQFVAGLAYNIGLESIHAARIVSAAVAARTRSCFLQSWALKMQGKFAEAVAELSKICIMHSIFPPEESSPEMEMVALGLEKQLQLEQRKLLMDMLVKICGQCRKSAADALGLKLQAEDSWSQHEAAECWQRYGPIPSATFQLEIPRHTHIQTYSRQRQSQSSRSIRYKA